MGNAYLTTKGEKKSFYCKYIAGEIDRQVDPDKLSQKKGEGEEGGGGGVP